MGVLSEGGRIGEANVAQEIERLKSDWSEAVRNSKPASSAADRVEELIGAEQLATLDLYDRIVIDGIVDVCATSRSMAEAGRKLFNHSRTQKTSVNDSHRIKQILGKYNLRFQDLSDS